MAPFRERVNLLASIIGLAVGVPLLLTAILGKLADANHWIGEPWLAMILVGLATTLFGAIGLALLHFYGQLPPRSVAVPATPMPTPTLPQAGASNPDETPAVPESYLTVAVRPFDSPVRISVKNSGPRDAWFEGELWEITGSTGSYHYPIQAKWAHSVDERIRIPSGHVRYLELARIDDERDEEKDRTIFTILRLSAQNPIHVSVSHSPVNFGITVLIKRVAPGYPTTTEEESYIKVKIVADQTLDPDGNEVWVLTASEVA